MSGARVTRRPWISARLSFGPPWISNPDVDGAGQEHGVRSLSPWPQGRVSWQCKVPATHSLCLQSSIIWPRLQTSDWSRADILTNQASLICVILISATRRYVSYMFASHISPPYRTSLSSPHHSPTFLHKYSHLGDVVDRFKGSWLTARLFR